MSIELDDILRIAIEGGASDIHLKVGLPPTYRISGKLVALKGAEKLTIPDLERLAATAMTERARRIFDEKHEVDLAYSPPAGGRFRVNIYQQRGTPGMALRTISTTIPTVEQLGLPPVVADLAQTVERGMVLVTGTTGSGKSSTLAAIINEINTRRNCHLMTIEDPIEFVFADKRSMVNQRELGQDTMSFNGALRAALRQDPDVILIGELRDLETIEVALHAAETGHMVLSTLHTLDATETVNRVISVFSAAQQQQIRLQLAAVLKAVLSQRLIRRKDGKGRVPAVEVMIVTERIRQLIESPDRLKEISDAIADGKNSLRSQTFDQSLADLVRQGLVDYEEARRAASNPADFELRFKGVMTAGDDMDFGPAQPQGGRFQAPPPGAAAPTPAAPSPGGRRPSTAPGPRRVGEGMPDDLDLDHF